MVWHKLFGWNSSEYNRTDTGGLIWSINPDYLWWVSLFYYAFLAIPLMMSVPELNEEEK